MMHCTRFHEDTPREISGEDNVNNMPVVIAPWSLRDLVRQRSGSYIIADTPRWDMVGPGKRMKKSLTGGCCITKKSTNLYNWRCRDGILTEISGIFLTSTGTIVQSRVVVMQRPHQCVKIRDNILKKCHYHKNHIITSTTLYHTAKRMCVQCSLNLNAILMVNTGAAGASVSIFLHKGGHSMI